MSHDDFLRISFDQRPADVQSIFVIEKQKIKYENTNQHADGLSGALVAFRPPAREADHAGTRLVFHPGGGLRRDPVMSDDGGCARRQGRRNHRLYVV
jgi:hypothetical protein